MADPLVRAASGAAATALGVAVVVISLLTIGGIMSVRLLMRRRSR